MSKSSVKSNNVEASLRQPYEGQLNKYTNMVKGWQHRWFILDPNSGMLEYHMSEAEKKLRPRGSLYLAGAIIVPSDEDSYSFSVNAANGEAFKLRASDARERQFWINRLRVVAQAHTSVIAETNPPLAAREHRSLVVSPSIASVSSTAQATSGTASNSTVAQATPHHPSEKILTCNLTVLDAFSSVTDCLRTADANHLQLVSSIEKLPSSGIVSPLDSDLLLLKATSQATLLCLEQCLAILHYQQQQMATKQQRRSQNFSAGSSPLLIPHSKKMAKGSLDSKPRADSAVSALSVESKIMPSPVTVNDTVAPSVPASEMIGAQLPESSVESNLDFKTEDEASEEEDLHEGTVVVNTEEAKTLPLLSQLKLGTELTRTALPVFLCEERSLLQLLADAFRKADTLVKIPGGANAEQRMTSAVEWYISCIEACRLKIGPAKKPFNPILGEIFKCSWNVVTEDKSPVLIKFWAEQVSHHPAVSAFHLECPAKKISVNGHLSVKAKFMGMYVGASLGGEVCLHLNELNEKYEVGFPSLYARSILAEPWLELGGKVSMVCSQTSHMSNIIFHTKPFYGGKAHHVSAEIKTANGSVACKMNGDWTSSLELTWTTGNVENIDLRAKPAYRKRIRPLTKQFDKESQKVWRSVAAALAEGDLRTAAEHKRFVEDRERAEAHELAEQGLSFTPRFFVSVGDVWQFRASS